MENNSLCLVAVLYYECCRKVLSCEECVLRRDGCCERERAEESESE